MANPLAWGLTKLGLRDRGPDEQQDFLEFASDMGADRLTDYERAERYYEGDHRVRLGDRERKFLEASGLPFAENFCETIVDAFVDRLAVRGFDSDNEEFANFAKELWRENRMDGAQILVHEDAVKLGDGFVIVEPGEDGGKPRICRNAPSQVKVVYDSGEPLFAVKLWKTARVSASNPNGETIRRLNVYWPDQIEKWFSLAEDGDWAPFVEKPGAESAVWWTMDGTASGEPIGIPVVHFANKPCPHYGRSELQGVFPQQDGLNKDIIDAFWVMDAQGWPQQWAKGVGDDQEFKRHPGSVWVVQSDEAEFGQFTPADPSKAIESIESQIKRMASRSRTPLHLMLAGGNLPSGETLKTSESGHTRKIGRFHVHAGNRWEDVVSLAARIEVAFGETDPPLDASLDCRWERAESRQEVDEANTAVLWQTLGVSQDTILSRLGFDPQEERAKRERDGQGAAAAQELLARARQMQAPTRSEERGGGEQPAQDPANRVVQQ